MSTLFKPTGGVWQGIPHWGKDFLNEVMFFLSPEGHRPVDQVGAEGELHGSHLTHRAKAGGGNEPIAFGD